MYRPGRPLLSNSEMRDLKQIARDGFATIQEMSDPQRTAYVHREDPDTSEFELINERNDVVVNYASGSGIGQGAFDESTAVVPTTGTIRGSAPWDIQLGDRVRLDNGNVLIITAPAPYERFGVIRARWRMEEGTP